MVWYPKHLKRLQHTSEMYRHWLYKKNSRSCIDYIIYQISTLFIGITGHVDMPHTRQLATIIYQKCRYRSIEVINISNCRLSQICGCLSVKFIEAFDETFLHISPSDPPTNCCKPHVKHIYVITYLADSHGYVNVSLLCL